MPTISAPHWLTVLLGAVSVCAVALEGQFPQYAPALRVVAAICAALAVPTITRKEEIPVTVEVPK